MIRCKWKILVSLCLVGVIALIPPSNIAGTSISLQDSYITSSNSWNRTYSYGSEHTQVYDITEYNDGGFVLVGKTGGDLWILRTDSEGEILTNQTLDLSGGTNVEISNDYNLIITSQVGPQYLFKVSPEGALVWNRTYDDLDLFADAYVCDDGSFILVGGYYPGLPEIGRACLMKTSSSGIEQWRNYYYGDVDWGYSQFFGRSVTACSDGGYFFAGSAWSSPHHDTYIVRTSSNGAMFWNKTLHFSGDETGIDTLQCSEGGFVVLTEGARTIKLDSLGEVMWMMNYTEHVLFSEDEIVTTGSIVECSGGGYAISGWANNGYPDPSDAFLIRTDDEGNVQWIRRFSAYPELYPRCFSSGRLVETGSGEFAISFTVENPRQMAWLIVTPDSEESPTETITTTNTTTQTTGALDSAPIFIAIGTGALVLIVIIVFLKKRS